MSHRSRSVRLRAVEKSGGALDMCGAAISVMRGSIQERREVWEICEAQDRTLSSEG